MLKRRFSILLASLLLPAHAAINKIVQGPYLQNPREDSMVLRWQTKKPSPSFVKLKSKAQKKAKLFQDLVLKTNHELTLVGLEKNTSYEYSIMAQEEKKKKVIANADDQEKFHFAHKIQDGELNIWVLGDPGVSGDSHHFDKSKRKTQRKVRNAFLEYYKKFYAAKNLDFVLSLGDNAYTYGSKKEFKKGFFKPYRKTFSETPLYTVFGNHDSGLNKEFLTYAARSYPKNRGVYYDLFSLPGKESYYSFDYQEAGVNVHIIVLDSFDSLWEDYNPRLDNYEKVWTGKSTEKNSMLEWFKKDLEENKLRNEKSWTIVAFHHPAFVDSEVANVKRQDIWQEWVNAYLLPLIHEYKVDLVLNGHIHNYQRTYPLKIEAAERPEYSDTKPLSKDREFKKDFIEHYLEVLQNLEFPYFKPVIASKGKTLYAKGEGVIYAILGSSGAAFKALPEKTTKMSEFFVAKMQRAGSIIINVNKKELQYLFISDEMENLDSFSIIDK